MSSKSRKSSRAAANNPAPATPAGAPTTVVAPMVSGLAALLPSGMSAEEEKQLTALEMQIKQITDGRKQREAEALGKLKTDIDGLLVTFKMSSFDELIELIRRHSKGLLGVEAPAAGTGRGRRLDADTKVRIDADVKADKDTVAVIAERHGCSTQYVQGRRKALGLTQTRAAK